MAEESRNYTIRRWSWTGAEGKPSSSKPAAATESLWWEVESLLAEAQGTGDFLEAPAVDVAARDLAASCEPDGHSHPAAIGHYRIIRLLGEGGMGTVYEAEQDEPRRLVALKVIKLGQTTPDRLRRFQAGIASPRAIAASRHRPNL